MILLRIHTKIFLIKRVIGVFLLFSFTATVNAEPWIDTSNLTLRSEIQYLADIGVIKAPVTTYPLMWDAIASDLAAADTSNLNSSARNAYYNVMNQLAFAQQNAASIKLNISNEDNRFTSFGDDFRDKNSLTVKYSAMGKHWALKVAPSYVYDPNDGDDFRLDESYIAGFFGNWVMSLGLQDRWLAPGWDTNLTMTNNARPMPSISLTRKNSKPVILPFTNNYQIPWTLTTFMTHMGRDRTIPNALLWGFRLNFKPYKRLEIGVNRLAQWAGDGRSSSLGTFWDLLLGRDNCGFDGLDCSDGTEEPGNQQAGIDARLSLPFMNHNIGIYGQYFAEDGSDGATNFVTKAKPQIGVDATVTIFDMPVLMFLEFTDTFLQCGGNQGNKIGDCYYEHHIYNTGLRYKGRVIGNIYDNDAKSMVFGMVSQMRNDASWQSSLRYVELNSDNHDRYPGEPNGNSVTEISEDMIMLSGKYQRIRGRWKFTGGGNISHSAFINKSSDLNFLAFIDIEYLL